MEQNLEKIKEERYIKIRNLVISIGSLLLLLLISFYLFVNSKDMKYIKFCLDIPVPSGTYYIEYKGYTRENYEDRYTYDVTEFLEFEPYRVHTVKRIYPKQGETINLLIGYTKKNESIYKTISGSPIEVQLIDKFKPVDRDYDYFTSGLPYSVVDENNEIVYSKGDKNCSLIKTNDGMFLFDSINNCLYKIKYAFGYTICKEEVYSYLSPSEYERFEVK